MCWVDNTGTDSKGATESKTDAITTTTDECGQWSTFL